MAEVNTVEQESKLGVKSKRSWWQRLKRWWQILWYEEYELTVWYVYETEFNARGLKAVKRTSKVYHLKDITKKTNTHIKGYDLDGMPFEIKTVDPFDYEIKKLK